MNDDTISRQAAIASSISGRTREIDGDKWIRVSEVRESIKAIPSAQPERLTDDDFETIRIHLNAYKEKLCNQRRWEEAEEYQRIIDRFMAFASAQPKVIYCQECKHFNSYFVDCNHKSGLKHIKDGHDHCSYAERRTDD